MTAAHSGRRSYVPFTANHSKITTIKMRITRATLIR
jgi:hypothetical protein